MTRPHHSRAPSMTARMRQIVLAYADWWGDMGDVGPPLSYFDMPNEVSEFRWREAFGDHVKSYQVLCSLAFDGTDGP